MKYKATNRQLKVAREWIGFLACTPSQHEYNSFTKLKNIKSLRISKLLEGMLKSAGGVQGTDGTCYVASVIDAGIKDENKKNPTIKTSVI
jgi:hypothetical protein